MDNIRTKPTTKAYREGWGRIFGRKAEVQKEKIHDRRGGGNSNFSNEGKQVSEKER